MRTAGKGVVRRLRDAAQPCFFGSAGCTPSTEESAILAGNARFDASPPSLSLPSLQRAPAKLPASAPTATAPRVFAVPSDTLSSSCGSREARRYTYKACAYDKRDCSSDRRAGSAGRLLFLFFGFPAPSPLL